MFLNIINCQTRVITLINEITNSFNESFKVNLTPLNLESKIRDVGDLFTHSLNNILNLIFKELNSTIKHNR